jgi:hypothetical protein
MLSPEIFECIYNDDIEKFKILFKNDNDIINQKNTSDELFLKIKNFPKIEIAGELIIEMRKKI